MTNEDLEKIVDTNDEWIRTRTGIRAAPRRRAGHADERARGPGRPGGPRSGAGSRPSEIDLIIVATVTPDMLFPATACLVQDKLKATPGLGLRRLGRLLRLPLRPHHGRAVRRDRRAQEGAGDRRRRDDLDPRLRGPHHLRAVRRRRGGGAARAWRGRHRDPRLPPRGGRLRAPATSTCPPAAACIPPPTRPWTSSMHFIRQEGQHVFKYAVRKFAEASMRLLERNGLTPGAGRPASWPTRPTSASSTPPRSGWACPTRRWSRTSTSTATPPPPPSRWPWARRSTRSGSRRATWCCMAAVGAGFTVGSVLLRWSGVDWS